MLKMVMLKPMVLTIVKDVPLLLGSAYCATNVENKGESATTLKPQKIKKAINNGNEAHIKNKGDNKQHNPDKNKAKAAVFLIPKYCEVYPAITQAKPPTPITIKL